MPFATGKDVIEMDKISVIHFILNDSDWDGVLENDPPPKLYPHNKSLTKTLDRKWKESKLLRLRQILYPGRPTAT